jgi:transcriptional regulator with PAS, ATPase and Fis domain
VRICLKLVHMAAPSKMPAAAAKVTLPIKAFIREALDDDRNLSWIARQLGVHRTTVGRWMRQWGIPYKANGEG